MAPTPMIQQYLQVKSEYQDAFLFFRLGDFYEMFYDDAIKASQLLEITLTSRGGNGEDRIPMCGVPHHSAKNYIDQLIQKGHKVAVCEQVEDPKTTKGVVKREVVRLITPGTHTEGKSVDAKANNFIAAADEVAGGFGLAYLDISTGESTATYIAGNEKALLNELQALHIRELVVSEQLRLLLAEEDQQLILSVEHMEAPFSADPALFAECPSELEMCGKRLLAYISSTQKQSLGHIQPFVFRENARILGIDYYSKRNLELIESIRGGDNKGTLLWLLDETVTAMGSRKLKQWLHQPLADRFAIEARQQMVEALMDRYFVRVELQQLLKQVYDLERLSGRVAFGSASGRDLAQLRNSLEKIPELVRELADSGHASLEQFSAGLDPCPEVCELLAALSDNPPLSAKEGGIIRDGFNTQLDEYRDASRNGKDWIAELEQKERAKTGIRSLKIGYNRIFGYYIEISKANMHLADLDRYERKQTLANAERYITPELKEKETLILTAEEKSLTLEYELFVSVREQVKEYISRIQQLASKVSALDVYISFSEVAEKYRFTKPAFNDGRKISIREGRHPVVEKMLNKQHYVPNDCELGDDGNMLLITGPNMSGKSTYMRQVALTIVLAQIGSYVPAASAELPIVDQIFTRIGAADDLVSGQSTFMVEMMESQYAITHATERSLLLFDEIGRGTSTYDGMALAQSMIEYIHEQIGANTLFSTHYHELTALEETLPKLSNVHVSAMEQSGKVVFLHKVKRGPADKSYGVHVAELANLPEAILRRARELLLSFEADNHKTQQQAEQLSFFDERDTVNEEVLQTIKDASISRMTPLEALQLINDLQEKISGGG
ncbi:DNA mismatch repair protein MutS [Planococcus sp. CP5-4]|uniref:DNA mismatch repair protein MutS n=1 Tax=unclassified Planococcus (in: firmicutes) TaxID=2662419 RepID=UPI001C20FE43|nr:MULTISPECIES: DNA mismatch repair protein MutS [unclassified Planococcus (in: firmicutes)]MBU9672035.1 DNA mismatch repair protein MutS [Planococcus sp. CP5-4_YE]MBV0907598.1 DNA mismatch repair protein MutS [Planococcus sp. CP5-4_UN]MBW6062765.1 DNA mismatch repair protein MutS [Planococcus sp. CP5-4]